MRLTPLQLSGHIGKGLKPIYLVAGEEPLLMQEALDALRAAARGEGYSEREVLNADKGFNWQQLADACNSLSLFASRRLIEVNLAGAPGDEGGKLLQQLAAHPPQDVLLIVICGALDSRARNAAWYLRLEEAGASLYCWPVKPTELPSWIAARLQNAGLDVEPEAQRLLAERTEGNLLACAQDIEKLKLLFAGRRIRVNELEQAVADSARYEAFDLSERVLSGDAAGAVRSLGRLREEGVAVLEILGALLWSLRQLARATQSYVRVRDPALACEEAGIRKFQQAPYLKALTRTRPIEALAWLRRAARIDREVKRGGEAAAWEDLLTLVLSASGSATRKSP